MNNFAKNETWSNFHFKSINLNSKEIYGIIMIMFNFFSALYIFFYIAPENFITKLRSCKISASPKIFLEVEIVAYFLHF